MRIRHCQLTEIIADVSIVAHALPTQLSIMTLIKCNENVTHMDMLHIRCNPAMHFASEKEREKERFDCCCYCCNVQKSQSQSQLRSSPMPKSVDSRVLSAPAKVSSAADSDANADADALRMRSVSVRQHSDRGHDRCHDRAGVVASVDVAQRRRIVSILKIRRDSEAYLL